MLQVGHTIRGFDYVLNFVKQFQGLLLLTLWTSIYILKFEEYVLLHFCILKNRFYFFLQFVVAL